MQQSSLKSRHFSDQVRQSFFKLVVVLFLGLPVLCILSGHDDRLNGEIYIKDQYFFFLFVFIALLTLQDSELFCRVFSKSLQMHFFLQYF